MADVASAGGPGAAPPLADGFLTRMSGAAVLPSLCLCLFPSLSPPPHGVMFSKVSMWFALLTVCWAR